MLMTPNSALTSLDLQALEFIPIWMSYEGISKPVKFYTELIIITYLTKPDFIHLTPLFLYLSDSVLCLVPKTAFYMRE